MKEELGYVHGEDFSGEPVRVVEEKDNYGNLQTNSRMDQAELWICTRNLLDCRCKVPIWLADAKSAESPRCGTGEAVSA